MPESAALAFDIGGTKINAGIVSRDGRVLEQKIIHTPGNREQILEALKVAATGLLGRVKGKLEIAGTGAGTAGVIQTEKGIIRYAPNLPLDEFPIGEYLKAFCPEPVIVLNDGRAAAFGEYCFGKLKGKDPMVCLFYGTGIGIGMIMRGKLVEGAGNAAGEVGHTIFKADGPLCRCGKKGCFEATCGGGPMTERALKEIGALEGDKPWTVGSIVEKARQGNAKAWKILSEAVEAFQILTANTVTLLSPRALVLGGGVLKGWPELVSIIEQGIEKMVHRVVRENLEIATSELGSDIILLGASGAVFRYEKGEVWR